MPAVIETAAQHQITSVVADHGDAVAKESTESDGLPAQACTRAVAGDDDRNRVEA
jgi:hypothetical protein